MRKISNWLNSKDNPQFYKLGAHISIDVFFDSIDYVDIRYSTAGIPTITFASDTLTFTFPKRVCDKVNYIFPILSLLPPNFFASGNYFFPNVTVVDDYSFTVTFDKGDGLTRLDFSPLELSLTFSILFPVL